MNSFVAFFFAGLIVQLSAGQLLTPDCPSPKLPAMTNFNPKNYFSRNWYVSHLYMLNKTQPQNFICLKSESEILTTLVHEIYIFSRPESGNLMFTEGFVSLASFSKGLGDYITEGRAIQEDGKPLWNSFIPSRVTLIDTDYEHYAVTYLCVPSFDGPSIPTYAVLSRIQNPEHIHPNVKHIVKKLGLNLEDFASSRKCKEV